MAKNNIKINTKVSSLQEVQKSLLQIEKQFNILLSQIHSPAEKELPETTGKTGDIQIIENTDKTYNFEVKTNKGWRAPYVGDSPVVFKSKSKVKPVKKSIDEIEEDDTNTGGRLATTTIYDEKNDKFVLRRADYNSGWTAMTAGENNVDFVHNLGVQEFSLFQVLVKDSSGRIFYPTVEGGYHSSEDYGIFVTARDDNTINVGPGNHGIYFYDNTYISNSTENIQSDGFIKILLWK